MLSGVSKGSIRGSILFNIFLNDLFSLLKNSDLHNFPDDNTIDLTCNDFTSFCQTLEQKPESAIDYFKNNSMIANLGNFQARILSKNATDVTHKLRIHDKEIEAIKSATLLGAENDY